MLPGHFDAQKNLHVFKQIHDILSYTDKIISLFVYTIHSRFNEALSGDSFVSALTLSFVLCA
jgi:hypothetical protein